MMLFKTLITDSDKFRAKERYKYIKNLNRLKKYLDQGNIKGISLQTRYLESKGVLIPGNRKECDKIIERLKQDDVV